MKNKRVISIFLMIVLLINTIFFTLGNGAISEVNNSGYTDLTVHEVWDLVNNVSNGIQYLIDVRYDSEWTVEHIDAPYPEYARHHCRCEWENESILQNFMDLYEGEEIILYCASGGRSVEAATTLVEKGFVGTIYNMVGGISRWKAAGYPTVPNRSPEKPTISGPSSGQPGEEIEFNLTANDPDFDEISFLIKWDNVSDESLVGPFNSGETTLVKHTWTETGIYLVKVKTIDHYQLESEWVTFEVSLSKTELDIINVKGGLGSVIVEIKNTGSYMAEEISSEIWVYGGLFSAINLTHVCTGCDVCGTTLEPGGIKTENTRESGIILGLGSIEVTISVWAKNAEKIVNKFNGFVFGPIIIIS